jgi:hypothetical protein
MGDSLAEIVSQISLYLRHNLDAFPGLICPLDLPLGFICIHNSRHFLNIPQKE